MRLLGVAAGSGFPLQQAMGTVQISDGIDVGHKVVAGGERTGQLDLQVHTAQLPCLSGRGLHVWGPEQRQSLDRHAEQRAAGTSAQIAATSEAALLGVAGYASDNGFTVTSVWGGSPAAQGGIKAGDIISKIDGKQVHSSLDIEAAIAANASGTVKLGYLIRGTWLTERDIKVR